ncbi:MAG TPA: efflux RND transporter periplasmic adaptor subunit, partial [Candidatus Obscuribacter sp.]|nr:efflux RND transporter periplasmic adaptor subunit [Candidatus Obscuribacter sp.]
MPLLLVSGLSLVFSLCGCQQLSLEGASKGGAAAGGPAMPPAMPVVVAPVRSAFVRETDSYVGTLKARKSVIIRSQVEGCITRIFVQSGQNVPVGAPLVEVDTDKQKEALASKLATRESLLDEKATADERHRALLADRQAKVANLDFTRGQYERYRGLRAEGAVAQENVDQCFNQLKAAEAELASIDAQIRAQESVIHKAEKMLKESLSQANQERVQLSHHTALAPFSGVVGDVPVRQGQYVDNSTELTTIDQSRPLEVYVYVPADRSYRLRLGLTIELLDVSGQLIGSCPVTFVSPEVGVENQSVLAKGLYDNPQGKLRSNQQVTARIVWEKKERLLVPTNSVV